MKENLLNLATDLVEFGKKNGADQIQINIGKTTDFSVEVLQGEIEKLTEATDKGVSIKVIIDGKTAMASSDDLKEDTLHRMIENAIKRAQLSGKDEFAGLPDKLENLAKLPDVSMLKLYDPNIESIDPEIRIKMAKEVEKIGLADKRIKISEGASFGSGVHEVFLANSNGFAGTYKKSTCSYGVGFQAGEGDNLVSDYWYESAINFDKLPNPEFVAKKALERVTRMIGARKVATQNAPIVMEPNIAASLILGFLSQCLAGSSIYMKRSFLMNSLEKKIGSDLANIVDNPLMPNVGGSRPFDAEGVPMRKNTIFSKGVLKSFILDSYSARKLKTKTTGNAGGVSNFYLENGNSDPKDIIKSVKNGLYLTGTIGQGTVPTTGDLSKGAFGLWIENGELTYPVSEITIAGNLAQMLADIEMVGNDLELKRSIASPTLKIREMSISGKG